MTRTVPLRPAGIVFFSSVGVFILSLLLLHRFLLIDSYISLTAAFTLSMTVFYISNRRSIMKSANYHYAGDFLLFAVAAYLLIVLATGILRQMNGSIYPWAIMIAAVAVTFGLLVYPR
ncbi:MAG: hypothetical protein ACLFVE_15625 [Chitinispirillaceae bacterium]